jgi:amicyanin
MLRRPVLAVMLGGYFLLAGAARGAVTAEAQVMVDNFTFSPAEITIAAGTRMTWTNRDDIPHTVTGRDEPRVMRSPALDTGDSYGVTFERPGTYRYFCTLHPHMQGKVVVQ